MKKCIKLLILVFALAMPISTWAVCRHLQKRGDKHEKRKIQGSYQVL